MALDRTPLPLILIPAGLWSIALRHSTPSLAWDDGPIFWNGAAGGIHTIIEPYGGYFHPFARSVALLARTVDAWWLGWVASLLVALYVASYMASDHLKSVLPERWQRLAAGIAVLVLPGTIQTLGLLGQVQWYGALFLLAWLVSGSASRIALGFFSILGPYSILFAPLVLLRRPSGWRIVLLGGVIQALGLLVSARSSGPEFDRLIEVLAFRGVLGPMLGQFSALSYPMPIAIGLVAIVGCLSVLAVASDRLLWPIFAGGAVVAIVGLLLAGESNTLLLQGSGARYFLGLGFGFVLFALRSPRNPTAWAIAAILLYGAKSDFLIPLRGFGWG